VCVCVCVCVRVRVRVRVRVHVCVYIDDMLTYIWHILWLINFCSDC